MAVEVETLSPTKVSLTIEVAVDKVKAEQEKVFKEMAKQVQIKGFRKGKAPRKMIEKLINQELFRKEVLERVVPKAYEEGLKSSNINPLTMPQFDIVHFQEGDPLKFKATFERRPEIVLPSYKGVEVTVEKREVKEEDIDRTLETLQNQRSTFEDLSDGQIEEGRGALVDFEGLIDGKPFDGGSSKGILLEIKKDWIVIPGFIEQLIGMRSGDERDVHVKMPANFDPEIAGKDAVFKVKVHAVKEKKIPKIDDEFAKAAGNCETVDKLREAVKGNIATYLEHVERNEGLSKALEELTENLDFPVPEILIEEQMKQSEREKIQGLLSEKKTFPEYLKGQYPEVFTISGPTEEEKTQRAIAKFREDLHPISFKKAKTDLILDEISHRENLQITQEEMNSEVRRLAESFHMTPDAIGKALQDQNVFQNFIAGMLRAKAALLIKEHLKISYQNQDAKS